MKRFIALLLAFMLTISLMACGSSGGTDAPPTSAPSQGENADTIEDNTQFQQPEEIPGSEEQGGTPDLNQDNGESPESQITDTSETSDASTEQAGAQEEPGEQTATPGSLPTQGEAPTVQTPPSIADPPADDTLKILIAYFTWADNTVVEDPSAIDVDATTSASVLTPGNAAKMASWIQREVGGDLHPIKVAEPYSSDYDECLDRAADEKADNARPALTSSVSSFDDYDIIFLGFPNWWYTLPMPVLSFVDGYDWSGKTVVPFVTHGTGGLASTMRDLDAALPDDVTRLDPIGVYRPEVDTSESTVREWAASLDLGIE